MTHGIKPIAEYPGGKPAYEIDELILDLDEVGRHDEAMRLYEENESILEAYWVGTCIYCGETVYPRSFGTDGPYVEGLGIENDGAWEAFHDRWTHNLNQLDDSRRPVLWASNLDVYNVVITVRASRRRRARPLYIKLSGQTLTLHENGPLGHFINLNVAAEILGLDIEQTIKVLATDHKELRTACERIAK